MSFERTVEGTIDCINRQAKTIRVTQEIKQGGNVQSLSSSFTLAPNVSVISSSRGVLKLAALKIGQKALIHYVTEPGGKQIANTIAVVEPAPQPQPASSFPGVQVAKPS